jgi:hypothetical protein
VNDLSLIIIISQEDRRLVDGLRAVLFVS